MSAAVEVWIGTRKGAFAFRSKDRKKWQAHGPYFGGNEVHHVVQDRRTPERFYAVEGNAWFGSHLHASSDGGKTWSLSEKGLTLEGVKLPETKESTLKRMWHVEPGAADEPGVVYLGAEPGALFKSGDDGANWELVKGLTLHPTRKTTWTPGAGGMMVHSIQALGKGRVIVGISAAGAFLTTDNGKTWTPYNAGVLANFKPEDQFPETGQCVHKLLAHPRNPEALYQQNHCGVYRTKLGLKKWTDVSKGLPSRFGFCLAVPAAEKQTMFTIPIDSPAARHVPEGKLRVGRSRDGGKTWELMTKGLPQKNAYVLIFREAMASDDREEAGIYFGTSTGTLYHSRNGGDSWHVLAENLPPIYSVSTAVV